MFNADTRPGDEISANRPGPITLPSPMIWLFCVLKMLAQSGQIDPILDNLLWRYCSSGAYLNKYVGREAIGSARIIYRNWEKARFAGMVLG